MSKSISWLLIILVLASCATTARPPSLASDEEVSAFVGEIAEGLETHDWQRILAVADPRHYQVQVAEHGMEESQYIAELFGLNFVDNTLRTGDSLDWSDLERITSVVLNQVDEGADPILVRGSVTLEGGEMLELNARVTRVRGRLVLTGAVG